MAFLHPGKYNLAKHILAIIHTHPSTVRGEWDDKQWQQHYLYQWHDAFKSNQITDKLENLINHKSA